MTVVSNKWRNTISIKRLFQDETTPELVITLCNSLIKQLNTIKERESKGNLTEDEKCNVDNKLFEVIDHFEFLLNLAQGATDDESNETRIPESEWDDYEFDGNFEQWFNDYMTELYDLADERVNTINGINEKFIWID
jgi:hypothetical protein